MPFDLICQSPDALLEFRIICMRGTQGHKRTDHGQANLDGPRAVKDIGGLDRAMFGEGPGQLTHPASPL
ncbi:MAG: hypothetical protein RL067_198 [Verrucomicrobiota bacterium]